MPGSRTPETGGDPGPGVGAGQTYSPGMPWGEGWAPEPQPLEDGGSGVPEKFHPLPAAMQRPH